MQSRLREALRRSKLSVYQLQKRLKTRGVAGAAYGSVYAYFEGEVDKGPPIEFLAAAAEEMGVRKAWLAFGEGGPTEAEEAIRQTGEALAAARPSQHAELRRDLAEAVPELHRWAPAAQGVFLEAWTRYLRGFQTARGFRPHHLRAVARHLFETVEAPLKGPGFNKRWRDAEHFEDYLLPMLHALMQAMPDAKEGELIEGAFPEPEEDPAPKRESRRRAARPVKG